MSAAIACRQLVATGQRPQKCADVGRSAQDAVRAGASVRTRRYWCWPWARPVTEVDVVAPDGRRYVVQVARVPWPAKYVYGFWRPITAVNLADTDGNPATIADPTWMPLA